MSDVQPNESETAAEELAESEALESEIVDPDEETEEFEPKGTPADGPAPLP